MKETQTITTGTKDECRACREDWGDTVELGYLTRSAAQGIYDVLLCPGHMASFLKEREGEKWVTMELSA